MFAGGLHRGGACARGGVSIDAQLLPCLSAAVTAVEGKSSTTSSGVFSRQSLRVGSQWAAHPLKVGGMCASTSEKGLWTRGPSGRVLRATVRHLGSGSVTWYLYRRVRLLGRMLAFRFGLLGWRCLRSVQRGVGASHGSGTTLEIQGHGCLIEQSRSHAPFPVWARRVVTLMARGTLLGVGAPTFLEGGTASGGEGDMQSMPSRPVEHTSEVVLGSVVLDACDVDSGDGSLGGVVGEDESDDLIGPLLTSRPMVLEGAGCWVLGSSSLLSTTSTPQVLVVGGGDTLLPCQTCDGDLQDASAPPPPRSAASMSPPRRRPRRSGSMASHVRFLQHLFRRCRAQRPGSWGTRGGLRGIVLYRPVTVFRCRGGRCLAGEDAFAEMQRRKVDCLEYYNIYVDILARLSNRTPRSYHPFAAAGADAEGVRRSRGSPFGSDILDQPHFRAWFGERAFQVSDASVRSALKKIAREWDPDVIMASPPCQPYSTADMQGATKAVAMIPLIRDHLSSLGALYAIENVKGASREMGSSAVLFYGAYFGEHVDRPRFFEANFPLVIDEYLRVPGLALRRGMCLGGRRKWRRLDPFGRPEPVDCCEGNIYPIQGAAPNGFTHEEGARAMGLDPRHMPFERLSQGIPPSYAQLVFAQACMERCRSEFGVPVHTFDQMLASPARVRRSLAFWLRGAGGLSPGMGVELSGPVVGSREPPSSSLATVPLSDRAVAASVRADYPESRAEALRRSAPGSSVVAELSLVSETEFREVFYSRHGAFDRQWVEGGGAR